jgi:hypothetical protein
LWEIEGRDKVSGLINQSLANCRGHASVGKTTLAGQSPYRKSCVRRTPEAVNTLRNQELPVPHKATFIYFFVVHKDAGNSCNIASNILMIFICCILLRRKYTISLLFNFNFDSEDLVSRQYQKSKKTLQYGSILIINTAVNTKLAPDDDPLGVETCCIMDTRPHCE